MIEAVLIGDKQLEERLKQIPDKVMKALRDRMMRTCVRIQRQVIAKLNGPVLKRRTGTLSRSIHVVVMDDGQSVVGKVGTNVEYAAVHEYGGMYWTPPHRAHWVKGPGGGRTRRKDSWIVTGHTSHYAERSFLRSTLEENRQTAIEEFKQVLADLARENTAGEA